MRANDDDDDNNDNDNDNEYDDDDKAERSMFLFYSTFFPRFAFGFRSVYAND